MLATIATVLLVILLAGLLVFQRRRARTRQGLLLAAIEGEAHAEKAAAVRPSLHEDLPDTTLQPRSG